MHVLNTFYENHKADIERLEREVLQAHPQMAKLQCAEAGVEMGPIEPFIKEKTPTALRAYITGVFMRSWAKTEKNLGRVKDEKTNEILYAAGVALSRLGSYVIIHSENGQERLNAADRVITKGFAQLAEGAGVSLEVSKFEGDALRRRASIRRDAPPGRS